MMRLVLAFVMFAAWGPGSALAQGPGDASGAVGGPYAELGDFIENFDNRVADNQSLQDLDPATLDRLRAVLGTVRSPADMAYLSRYSVFGDTELCSPGLTSTYDWLGMVCDAPRADGIPDEVPRIVDPLIVRLCSLPIGLQPDDPTLRRTCREMNEGQPDNPLANLIREIETRRREERQAEAVERQNRAVDYARDEDWSGQLNSTDRVADPATSLDAME